MSGTAFTYEDYAALPDDGHRYEVHDGELSVTPSPGTWLSGRPEGPSSTALDPFPDLLIDPAALWA